MWVGLLMSCRDGPFKSANALVEPQSLLRGCRGRYEQGGDCLRLHYLPETEFGVMLAAVIEFDNEHPASSFPSPVSLPYVVVLVCGRVVTQTTVAGVDRFFNHRALFAGEAQSWSDRSHTQIEAAT